MRGRSRRNDLRQYDELAGEWWRSHGAFAALHWLARARGELIPSPSRPDAELLDLRCGGGLLAPYVFGYRHVGVDLSASALEVAARHGVEPVKADRAVRRPRQKAIGLPAKQNICGQVEPPSLVS